MKNEIYDEATVQNVKQQNTPVNAIIASEVGAPLPVTNEYEQQDKRRAAALLRAALFNSLRLHNL
jgi:hypothetical protein